MDQSLVNPADARRAFLAGLGCTAIVFPTGLPVYGGWTGRASETGELAALRSDWERIGQDLGVAAKRVAEREVPAGQRAR